MFRSSPFRPALRLILCGLLVLSMGATVWAQGSAHVCAMPQGGTNGHHCGGTTTIQSCDCEDGATASLPILAKVGRPDPIVDGTAISRTFHTLAPMSSYVLVVPSRGLRRTPIPILHSALLI